MEYVITFKNTNLAIKAEKRLLDLKLGVTVMPLPSQIRAGCGICLRVKKEELRGALNALKQASIKETSLFSRESVNGVFVYTEITGGVYDAWG